MIVRRLPFVVLGAALIGVVVVADRDDDAPPSAQMSPTAALVAFEHWPRRPVLLR